jgi:hypothetical protein
MKHLITFTFILIANLIFSQIIVTDNNNKPIPFVEVLSNNKHFYGQTNQKGELNWSNLEKLNPKDTLFFNLVSYERVSFVKNNLSPIDTIRLKERINVLQEFTVDSNRKKDKYQLIKACYRSYQMNDDSVSYYLDGKADYLSTINKNNFDIFIKEKRSFANKVVEDETVQRSVGIYWTPSVTRPPFYYLPSQDKNHTNQYNKDSSKVDVFNKKGIHIASFEKDRGYIKYIFYDFDFEGTNNFAKTEVKRIKHDVIMIFRYYEGLDFTVINNFDNLLYYKSIREYTTQHDKASKHTKIVQVSEMFIEDVSYYSSVDKKELNPALDKSIKSIYTSAFWKSCNCEVYEPPNPYLLKNLYER